MPVDTTKPAFLVTNYAATATITASEEATGHDADELKVASYAETYRTTGVTADRNIDLDLGASKTDIQAIVLWGTNLTDAAELQLFGDGNAGFPSPEHDSTQVAAFDTSSAVYVDDTPPWGRPAIYLPASDWTARYVRYQLTDTANGDGYLEAAYAFVGPIHQPAAIKEAAWTPAVEIIGPPGRSVAITTHRLTLVALTDAARRGVLSLERALHQTGRFGFIPRTDDDANWLGEAVLCTLAGPVEQLPYFTAQGRRWDLSLSVREVTD